MKKIFLGVYNPSIILTYIGVFCSVCGMGLLCCRADLGVDVVSTAIMLLVGAGVCDMFDGSIARLCKRTEQEKAFGIQLDSLADVVSFGIFPAAILLYVTNMNVVSIVIALFYVFAGIMRLGWFNVTTEENKGYFFGMPIAFAAIIFPSLYLLLKVCNLPHSQMIVQAVYALTALAFILNFRMKKPGLVFFIVMFAMAIGVVTCLLIL